MSRPYHKRVGASIGCDVETETVIVRCACGWVQQETYESDAPLRAQLAETSCARCGVRGQVAIARMSIARAS